MSPGITRRRALATVGAAGLAGLAGCSSSSDENSGGGGTDTGTTPTGTTMGGTNASGTVKIRGIQPISGDLQYYGQQGVWGFSSGLAYKAGEVIGLERISI